MSAAGAAGGGPHRQRRLGAERRVLVYGEIDLNLVDGSSVWLQSVCQALASIGDVPVTLLPRRRIEPERGFLVAELAADPQIEIADPGHAGTLTPARALDRIGELEARHGAFDAVLLRGSAVLAAAIDRPELAGRLWPYAMTGRGLDDDTVRRLARASHRVLCQTDAVADELRAIAPELADRLHLLPPMIPEAPQRAAEPHDALRLVYAGKLSPEYCWLETVSAFAELRSAGVEAELHVIGDKVHRPPEDPGFHARATHALSETDGLRWHGAVARDDVPAILGDCDLALSIRDPAVDGTREISTKVLEYGAAGLPVVLNRAPVYERLLGADYPLFLSHPREAAALLRGPALDPAIRREAAAACRAASAEFSLSRAAARLADALPPPGGGPPTAHAGPRVLVAGHDLRFLGPVRESVAAAGARLAEDVWDNHREHSERASRAALREADTVLCEWCLGNAAWYSRNVGAGQRLVIRVHRMEVDTDHPRAVAIDRVDGVVFVSRHIMEAAVERFGWARDRLRVIPNAVDCARLRRPKRRDAGHVLALIGYVPTRKRLDLALDVLEELRRHDRRFRMLVVGRPPSDFEWVTRRDEEVDAFRAAYARMQESELLRGAVDVRPFTDDLPSLLEGVGWIASTSDSEGHQVSLAEGAASGAIPVILDRPGAGDQYPDRWVHATPAAAAAAVLALPPGALPAERTAAADHAATWSPDRIIPQWLDVLGLDKGP